MMAMVKGTAVKEPGSSRRVRVLAWGGFGLVLVVGIGADFLAILNIGTARLGETFGLTGFYTVLAIPGVVGALAASRLPRNPIGWLLIVSSFGLTLQSLVTEWGVYNLLGGHHLPGGWLGPWIQEWVWIPFMSAGAMWVMFLFPTGRLASARWRWPFRVSIGSVVVASVAAALSGDMEGYPASNPLLVDAAWVEAVFGFGMLAVMGSFVTSAVSLVARARRARGVERLQIRWVKLSGSVVAIVLVLYGGASLASGLETVAGGKWAEYLIQVAFLGIPVSVGFAIMRYRLYDIDRIINKTIVYGLLTALLAGFTAVFAIGLSAAVRAVAGEDQNTFVVAISTLAAAAAFRPLRARVQAVIDRRFYRSRYDAQHALESFGVRLRDEVDLGAVRGDMLSVVQQTLQPAHASVWFRAGGAG